MCSGSTHFFIAARLCVLERLQSEMKYSLAWYLCKLAYYIDRNNIDSLFSSTFPQFSLSHYWQEPVVTFLFLPTEDSSTEKYTVHEPFDTAKEKHVIKFMFSCSANPAWEFWWMTALSVQWPHIITWAMKRLGNSNHLPTEKIKFWINDI